MAFSPALLVLSPTPPAAAGWNVLLTLGEVLWSPRNSAWQSSLAPTGREGLFVALASARTHLTPLLDVLLGHLNQAYNPNCPACRDDYGHFCSLLVPVHNVSWGADAVADGASTCGTQHGACVLPTDSSTWGSAARTGCPTTCHDCPGWSIPGNGRYLWLALTVFSLCGPLLVWLLLPFLRGEGELRRGCYGVVSAQRCVGTKGHNEEQQELAAHRCIVESRTRRPELRV